MAESPVNVTNLTTGVPIAAEQIVIAATTAYAQQVKLLAGQSGGTTGIPGDAGGLYVQLAGSTVPQVAISAMPAVAGTVSISGAVQVSGSVAISGTGLVSVVPGVSVIAQVSGAVSVSAMPAVSGTVSVSGPVQISGAAFTTASSGLTATATGLVVVATGTVTATVVGTISVSNFTTVVSGAVSVSGTAIVTLATGGTLATLLGTVAVNVVAGGAGGGSVTTAGPSISATGQIVWVAGGQSAATSPVFVSQINPPAAGGGSVVTTQAGGTSTGQLMWLAATQTLASVATVGTILGTQVVSVVPGLSVTIVGLPVTISGVVPVTTQASVSVTAFPVIWNPTATVVVGNFTTVASGSLSVINVVSVTGTSLNVVASGTVSVVGLNFTTAGPSISASGVVVWIAGGQSSTADPIVITGTVTAGAGTTVVSLTGSALVSGTVTLGNINMTTGNPSVSASGQVMWIAGGQSTTAEPVWVSQIGGIISVTGLVTATGTLNVGTLQTIISTVNVVLVAGVAGGGMLVTTGTPTATASGAAIWIVGGQATTANPVVVTGTVTAGAGTTVVSIQNIVGVTTAASVSVTGLPVWLNPTQTVAVSGAISAVTTQLATTGAAVWLAPTQTINVGNLLITTTQVTTGAAQAVWIMNPTTVTITIVGTTTGTVSLSAIVPVTTQASVSLTGLPVWFAAGAAVGFSSGLLTTAGPSVSATGLAVWNVGLSVTVTQTAITGQVMWLAPTQTMGVISTVVTVLGTVNVNNIDESIYTKGLTSGNTGVGVWPGTPGYSPVLIFVSSTAIAQSAAFYQMTIWTGGTLVAAGTTAYPIPAGHNLRILNIQAIMTSSATVGGSVQFIAVAATATASMVSASFRTQGFLALAQGVVTALPVSVGPLFVEADVPAGTTVGVAIVASVAAVLQNCVIQGYLF